LAEAFLNVPLYEAIYSEFRGRTLPPAPGLQARIRALGVPEKQTKHARQVMLRSAETAGYQRGGSDRLVKPPVGAASVGAADGGESGKKSKEPDRERDKGHDSGDMQDHPLIAGLVKMLPKPGEPFTEHDRRLWLRAADMNLALLYKGQPALPEEEVVDEPETALKAPGPGEAYE
jgi:hypothetical protein